MPHPRTLGSARLGALLIAATGCVTALPAQRPSDTYVTENVTVADGGMGEDEKNFIDDLNKELVRQGWPSATPGAYEMNSAQVVARALFEQHWSTSGTKSSPSDAPVKPMHALLPKAAPPPAFDQYAIAYGLVPDFASAAQMNDYATHRLGQEDIEQIVYSLRWRNLQGKARIGVAILPDPQDAHRIFAAVMRDERVRVVQGVPRTTAPGSTISIQGKMIADDLPPILSVLRPDGKVDTVPFVIDSERKFEVSYQLPTAPGKYVVSLTGTNYIVPVFAGVEPTPWPPLAPDQAAPPGTPQDAAIQLAKALESWRAGHGLPVLPISPELSSWARTEATILAGEDRDHGGAPQNPQLTLGSQANRLREARLEPAKTVVSSATWRAATFPDELAVTMDDPRTIERLSPPDAAALGIGVALVPRTSPDDPPDFHLIWLVATSEPLPEAQPAGAGVAPKSTEPPKAGEPPSTGTPAQRAPPTSLPTEGQPPHL